LISPIEMTPARGTDAISVEIGEDDCFVKMQLNYGLSSNSEAQGDIERLRDVQHKFPDDIRSKLREALEKAMRDTYSPLLGHYIWELEVDKVYLDVGMRGDAQIELSFHVKGVVYTEDSNTVFNLSWRDFKLKENIICQAVAVDPDLFAFKFDEYFGSSLNEWNKTIQDKNTILEKPAEIELYTGIITSTRFTIIIPYVEGVTIEPDIVHVKGATTSPSLLAQAYSQIQQHWVVFAFTLVIVAVVAVYYIVGRERLEDLVDRIS